MAAALLVVVRSRRSSTPPPTLTPTPPPPMTMTSRSCSCSVSGGGGGGGGGGVTSSSERLRGGSLIRRSARSCSAPLRIPISFFCVLYFVLIVTCGLGGVVGVNANDGAPSPSPSPSPSPRWWPPTLRMVRANSLCRRFLVPPRLLRRHLHWKRSKSKRR